MPDKSTYKVEVLCPDVAAKLHLERGVAKERLAEPFEMHLALYSDDLAIDLQKVLGQKLAVRVATANGERFFHGIVTDFAFTGTSTDGKQRLGHYQATVRPQLWLLGQGQRSRVFQDQKATDIVKAVCADYGFAPTVDSKLAVSFEHAVQYRETDLHFLSRVLERHGVYYFFQHEKGKHTVKMVDGLSGHQDFGTFAHAADGAPSEEYQVLDWRATTSIRSGLYHVTGTTHLTPSTKVQEKAKSRFKAPAGSALEIYDFEATTECPKPYLDVLARVRQEAVDAGVEEYTGRSASLLFAVGGLFKLKGHPRDDQNKEYLVVSATYEIPGMPSATGTAVDQQYQVAFTAIDSKTPFRPPVLARRPVVQGPHTAVVTEETDDLGRVKVRFHWGNKEGELESCFARVSQNWAGKQWGGTFLPHAGHEVIVEFLDGDPDQPLVTGRVYNKENKPPLSLPGDKQQSIIQDHCGNKIVMDGKAKTIHIFCPSHDSQITLGKSVEIKSVSNWVNDFQGYREETIAGKSTSKVGQDHQTSIGGSKQENIIGKFSLKVGADVQDTLLGAQHRNIVGLTSLFVGGMKKEHIGGAEWKRIDGLKREKINGATMKKGNSKEMKTYPDAVRHVKGMVLDKLDDWKCKVKGEYFLKVAKRQEEADELAEKAKNVKIDYKTVAYTGEFHKHAPSDKLHMHSGKVMIYGRERLGLNGPVHVNGNALEVKE